jgi:hypothetical protein
LVNTIDHVSGKAGGESCAQSIYTNANPPAELYLDKGDIENTEYIPVEIEECTCCSEVANSDFDSEVEETTNRV